MLNKKSLVKLFSFPLNSLDIFKNQLRKSNYNKDAKPKKSLNLKKKKICKSKVDVIL